jgi:multiple sugar transport system substrate-binding protein
LQSALGRKEGPDIFRFHQSWTPMLGNYLSSIPETIYDTSSFNKTFYPSAAASLRYQSKLVGLPLEFDGLALFYNEDLFRAAGKNPPQTWEELEKTAQDGNNE